MKNAFLILLFLTFFKNFVKSQSVQDGEFIFKSSLYFGRPLFTPDSNKSKRLIYDFQNFITNTKLILDTLETNIYDNYVFVSLRYSDKNVLNNEGFCIFKSISRNKEELKFVICIDKETGEFYRIRGYNHTDLLSFWDSIKQQHDLLNRNKSQKIFLRNFWVKGLDLKCLLFSIGKPHNVNKYPCTFNESDLMVITY